VRRDDDVSYDTSEQRCNIANTTKATGTFTKAQNTEHKHERTGEVYDARCGRAGLRGGGTDTVVCARPRDGTDVADTIATSGDADRDDTCVSGACGGVVGGIEIDRECVCDNDDDDGGGGGGEGAGMSTFTFESDVGGIRGGRRGGGGCEAAAATAGLATTAAAGREGSLSSGSDDDTDTDEALLISLLASLTLSKSMSIVFCCCW
jgi:hypothetical protein